MTPRKRKNKDFFHGRKTRKRKFRPPKIRVRFPKREEKHFFSFERISLSDVTNFDSILYGILIVKCREKKSSTFSLFLFKNSRSQKEFREALRRNSIELSSFGFHKNPNPSVPTPMSRENFQEKVRRSKSDKIFIRIF